MKLIQNTNMKTLEINKQEQWIDLSPYHSLHEDTRNPSPLYELGNVFLTLSCQEISATETKYS
jgi:hypothetical protein